jgi:hypothetical protein
MGVPANASRRIHSLCIFAGSEKIYIVEKRACGPENSHLTENYVIRCLSG